MSDSPVISSTLPWLRKRHVIFAVAALVLIKLTILFGFALHARIVMDEFGQLGYAKFFGHGLFESIVPPKAVGFAAFYELAHFIGWDASSMVLTGRIMTAILACATLAIVFSTARTLGEDRLRALCVILVLLSFSNFIERIFRTIAEPLAVFFAAAALLVALLGNTVTYKRVLFAGLLSGLAFLTTQKSVYFNLALGLGLTLDALLNGDWKSSLKRGVWLVAGWLLAIAGYCLVFGGSDPLPIAHSLVFGPLEVATRGGKEYGGLRGYVLQTLIENMLLYPLCLAGIVLSLFKIRSLSGPKRIVLIFTTIITALVFAHDQPWPYVFIMALPFMALWIFVPLDAVSRRQDYSGALYALLAVGVVASFVRNTTYWQIDNAAQLELASRADALLEPTELYFDGIGILPNHFEPSTLWLDRYYVLKTLAEGESSEAYQVISKQTPAMIIWSYRMDAIHPVVAPIVDDSYVQVAPNIRLIGRKLAIGQSVTFRVPRPGRYRLYSLSGQAITGTLKIDGQETGLPLDLNEGSKIITLQQGPAEAFLLPEGVYDNKLFTGEDRRDLFERVYD